MIRLRVPRQRYQHRRPLPYKHNRLFDARSTVRENLDDLDGAPQYNADTELAGDNTSLDPNTILENINELLEKEKSLYKRLNESYTIGNDDIDEISYEISETDNNITKLYDDLYKSYNKIIHYNDVAKKELEKKIEQSKILEKDINDIKKILDDLNTNNLLKRRRVEINTYYSSKYRAQSNIIKIIIFFCVPLLIVSVLYKKDIIPTNIAGILIVLIIIVCVIFVSINLYDVAIRNDMNYDKYKWGDKPSSSSTTITGEDKEEEKVENDGEDDKVEDDGYLITPGCIDANCCSTGTTYNDEEKKCVRNIFGENSFSDIVIPYNN